MLGGMGAKAQINEVRYYNKALSQVNEADAHYLGAVRTYEAGSPAGSITFYTLDSVLVSHREYSNVGSGNDERELNGLTTYWYANGQKREQTNYVLGMRHGSHQEWYESGGLRYSMNYYKSELHGALLGYYENGRLRRQDSYLKNSLIEGVLLSENGEKLPHVPYLEMPEFLGGEGKMLAYLGKNMRYPAEAQRNGISGLVVMEFTVNKDGTRQDIEILKSAGSHLDREAIRVLQSMPSWVPGKREGVVEPMQYILPVRFSIR